MVRIMRQIENLETLSQEKSGLRRLVQLFSGATPMRIPISVVVPRGKGQGLEENTTIEYGAATMVFFESRLPLELEDKFHLQNSDGSLGADAIVVGLRFDGGRRAIAARLLTAGRTALINS